MGQTQGHWYSPELTMDSPLVVLNVYDLDANWLNMNGLLCDALQLGGAFHVGVEVFGQEWSFGTVGVCPGAPRHHDVHIYRQSITLGRTKCERETVDEILADMATGAWRGETYDILFKNCCAFAREFCYNILGRDKIPGWIDRLGNGLAEVFGPVGMTGASTPFPLNARAFGHQRQDSSTSQCSVDSEYAASEFDDSSSFHHQGFNQLQRCNTQPTIQSYTNLVHSQSFSHQGPNPLTRTSSYSSFPTSYQAAANVCRPGPPAFAPGVRRFTSAVY
jgi:hypothetical protein